MESGIAVLQFLMDAFCRGHRNKRTGTFPTVGNAQISQRFSMDVPCSLPVTVSRAARASFGTVQVVLCNATSPLLDRALAGFP